MAGDDGWGTSSSNAKGDSGWGNDDWGSSSAPSGENNDRRRGGGGGGGGRGGGFGARKPRSEPGNDSGGGWGDGGSGSGGGGGGGWGNNDGSSGWGDNNKSSTSNKTSDNGWGSSGNDGGWGASSAPSDDNNDRRRGGGRGRGGSFGGRNPRSEPRNDSGGGGWGDSGSGGGGGWGDSSAPSSDNNDRRRGRGGGYGDRNSRSGPSNDSGGGWGDSGSGGGGGWGDSSTPSGDNNERRRGRGGGGDFGERKPRSGPRNDADGGWGDGGGGSGGGRSRDDGQRDNFNQSEQEERPAPYKPEELNLEEEAKLQNDGVGENFHRYKDQKVTCIPIDRVKPIENFSDVIESKLLLENVKNLKYSDLTPIQKWAMPAIKDGSDIIGCAQTGSGKTAAFLLPILQSILKTDFDTHDPNSDCQNPYCLIISPTRELARQIHVHAEMLSRDSILKCHVIYGQIATAHLKAKLSQGCHVLVATPGRLKDFVQRGWIGFKNIKFIVLDEGDRLVDDGFMTDIQNIFNHETMPPKDERQTLLFSATFKAEVQASAKEFLKDSFIFLTVGRVGAANEDIKQEFLQVARQEKKRELRKILSTIPETDKTIVFTQTKQVADILAGFFSSLNLSSTSIHGDRHQSQREQAISTFKRGEKRFLISSPVGNRGLDLPKVALVINYDLPNNIDEYVHRIGRTGRAGHTGRAISFFDTERDNEILPDLITILEEAKQEIPEWMRGGGGGGGGFSAAAGEDDWGAPSSNPGQAAAPAPAEDDWGASSSTTNTKKADDDWGTSSSQAKETNDDWGSSTSTKRPSDEPPQNTTKRHDAGSDDWASGW